MHGVRPADLRGGRLPAEPEHPAPRPQAGERALPLPGGEPDQDNRLRDGPHLRPGKEAASIIRNPRVRR